MTGSDCNIHVVHVFVSISTSVFVCEVTSKWFALGTQMDGHL